MSKELEETRKIVEKYEKIQSLKSDINDFCKELSLQKGYRFIDDLGSDEECELYFYVEKNIKDKEIEEYIEKILKKYRKYIKKIKPVPEAIEDRTEEEIKEKKIKVEMNLEEVLEDIKNRKLQN